MDIMTRVREHYEIAKTIVSEELIVGCFLYGSQNYNMADENSDVDTRVLVVPSLADVVCARRPVSFEHHCENGEHINFVDVREFVHQLLKQNPNSLEILFTDHFIINPPFNGVWYYIWSKREDFARINPHKAVNTMRAFMGSCGIKIIPYIFLGISLTFLVIGMAIGIFGPREEITRYQVLINDSVSFIEFNDRYEIINQDGAIYTIQEREP